MVLWRHSWLNSWHGICTLWNEEIKDRDCFDTKQFLLINDGPDLTYFSQSISQLVHENEVFDPIKRGEFGFLTK